MISGQALVNKVREAYEAKWGYIWGTRGQVWTQKQQDNATREMTVKYGQKWVGKRVADCSGLIKWAMRELGGDIYHGSNTIFNKYCSETGPVAGTVKIRVGTAVFQNTEGTRGHIGLYIGGGMCIEAKGTQHGVVSSPLAVWDEWGVLKDVDYTGTIEETFGILPLDTITKGAKGELVKYLQRALAESGYEVGEIDGIFGSETLSTVRAFQSDHNLTPDGKVGKLTWAAIKALVDDDEPDEYKPEEVPDEPKEPEDTWATLSIEEKVENLNERLKRQEGGNPNV